jgi:hypothetical protein
MLPAIDQVLSYLSWRDTKAAVLVFNRRANFSSVLEKIAALVPVHPCFEKDLGKKDESTFSYLFHQPDDPDRHVYLAVMAFDIPTVRTKSGPGAGNGRRKRKDKNDKDPEGNAVG